MMMHCQDRIVRITALPSDARCRSYTTSEETYAVRGKALAKTFPTFLQTLEDSLTAIMLDCLHFLSTTDNIISASSIKPKGITTGGLSPTLALPWPCSAMLKARAPAASSRSLASMLS